MLVRAGHVGQDWRVVAGRSCRSAADHWYRRPWVRILAAPPFFPALNHFQRSMDIRAQHSSPSESNRCDIAHESTPSFAYTAVPCITNIKISWNTLCPHLACVSWAPRWVYLKFLTISSLGSILGSSWTSAPTSLPDCCMYWSNCWSLYTHKEKEDACDNMCCSQLQTTWQTW